MKDKIVFISHSSDLYGAPRALLILLEKLDLNKINPVVICPSAGPLVDRINSLGIPTYVLPRYSSEHLKNRNVILRITIGRVTKLISIFRYILKFLLVLNNQKPRLIYVNTIAHGSPLIPSRILRIPTIVHVHEPE